MLRDLLHFYRAGPGNKNAGAMGWLWLNVTQDLISQERIGGVYFSFVHDGDIIPVLAALGIYSGHNPLQRNGTRKMLADFRIYQQTELSQSGHGGPVIWCRWEVGS